MEVRLAESRVECLELGLLNLAAREEIRRLKLELLCGREEEATITNKSEEEEEAVVASPKKVVVASPKKAVVASPKKKRQMELPAPPSSKPRFSATTTTTSKPRFSTSSSSSLIRQGAFAFTSRLQAPKLKQPQ
ncbi:hypothetical protein BASA81_010242 [Batrachochytrium salamandrivorans]|nr:hypothetical protein BASA81_010242 [Batrachochytrium salamandrivorans]